MCPFTLTNNFILGASGGDRPLTGGMAPLSSPTYNRLMTIELDAANIPSTAVC